MKKIILILVCIFTMMKMQAVPAYPYPVTISQPDGSSLVIVGHGDEYYHFLTTADGYTIVKNDAGYYVYAQLTDGALAPTTRIARNVEQRSASDEQFLTATSKFLCEKAKATGARKARKRVGTKESQSFYNKFRGLVILVNFKDREFFRADANSLYTHMINDKGYTGYTGIDGSSDTYGSMFIGSVSDYYRDNSNGLFNPQFDVVGPVTIDMASTGCQGTTNGPKACDLAVKAADSKVDFSKYDADGDGYVDMIFFLFAGYGANYSGNSSNYIWPHQSSLVDVDKNSYDGKKLGIYACSTEFYGLESQGSTILDGIGTICHEFGHAIGLPDIYDTDYAESGGQSNHPGQWDIMASGSYLQYGRTPAGYSAVERYILGFLQPTTINAIGNYSLEALQKSNKAYLLTTPQDSEVFVLENRQKIGWDVNLPSHGMLVWHADYTNMDSWYSNQVNVNPLHNYLEILRAGEGTTTQSPTDPFPGTMNVTGINNFTSPSFKNRSGTKNEYGLAYITESNGTISFRVFNNDCINPLLEYFENMPKTTSTSATGVQGEFAKWDFTKCNVTDAGAYCTGQQAVAMKKPSAMTMSEPMSSNPYMVRMLVSNPTTTTSKIGLYYRTPDETTWTEASPGAYEISAGGAGMVAWTMNLTGPHYYRIYESAGSTTAANYIDNLYFYYLKTSGGDVNQDGKVDVSDVTALINMILSGSTDTVGDVNGNGSVDSSDLTALLAIILSN